jgi:hypothetical protein
VIDVMPTAEAVLGFSNPWYELGIATGIEQTLSSGKRIRAGATGSRRASPPTASSSTRRARSRCYASAHPAAGSSTADA